MGRGRKKDDGLKSDPNGWMMTFSDLITLLLTFFVLLMSMSTISTEKLQEIFSKFPGADRVMEGGSIKPTIKKVDSLQTPELHIKKEVGEKHSNRVDPEQFRAIYDWLVEKKLNEKIKIVKREKSFEMRLDNEVAFESGSKELKKNIVPFLKEVALMLKQDKKSRLSVDSYATDPAELMDQEEFLTLEDLAIARSEALVEAFLGKTSITSQKISIMGYDKARRPKDKEEDSGVGQWIEFVIKEDMRM